MAIFQVNPLNPVLPMIRHYNPGLPQRNVTYNISVIFS